MFYAEYDTDKVIRDKYFPNYEYRGIIVEVGSATPEFLSMTKHFRESGWRAIHIEPNPKFVEMHLEVNNEIYQYACGSIDEDDVDFTVVTINENNKQNGLIVSDHSYSSFYVKEEYKNLDIEYFERLKTNIIKVKCRRLDSIFDELKLTHVDVLSVDTEGWEIEVMSGLTKIKPKLVILENILHLSSYIDYMSGLGYTFDGNQDHNYFFKIK